MTDMLAIDRLTGMTTTADTTTHNFEESYVPRSTRDGGDCYYTRCSCGWRAPAPSRLPGDGSYWNDHMAAIDRPGGSHELDADIRDGLF